MSTYPDFLTIFLRENMKGVENDWFIYQGGCGSCRPCRPKLKIERSGADVITQAIINLR